MENGSPVRIILLVVFWFFANFSLKTTHYTAESTHVYHLYNRCSAVYHAERARLWKDELSRLQLYNRQQLEDKASIVGTTSGVLNDVGANGLPSYLQVPTTPTAHLPIKRFVGRRQLIWANCWFCRPNWWHTCTWPIQQAKRYRRRSTHQYQHCWRK